ncbi:cobalamin B12-binding domain-containing protein [Streptomyces sp. NPDC054796]
MSGTSEVRGRGGGIDEGVRGAFDTCLVRADEEAAVTLVEGLVADGVSAEEVLLGLVGPAQIAVGARWAADRWTVAQEHAATHVSERCVIAVAEASRRRDGTGRAGDAVAGGVVVACGDGEWHTLPARLLAEVLRLRGFRVRFLGGHVPTAQLLSDVHQNGPDVIALSCTLGIRLPPAHHQIEVCRKAGVPVLAGGPGFGPEGARAHTLGADLYAPDAPAAAELLERHWPPRLSGTSRVRTRWVTAYAWIVRHRTELLREATARLRGAVAERPAPSGADGLRGGRPPRGDVLTTGTVGQLLDALAAAVYTDDPRVFTDDLAFTAGFLAARSVDPARLRTVLRALAGPLRDSPHALAHLAEGERLLDAWPGASGPVG